MGKVLDFNSKFEEKNRNTEKELFKAWFYRMFGDQPKHVLDEIREAIRNEDKEKYDEITVPIILRKTMVDLNKGLRK
ncbi:hypothetical protein ACSS31_28740 (plasmid) [Priestia megaterium]